VPNGRLVTSEERTLRELALRACERLGHWAYFYGQVNWKNESAQAVSPGRSHFPAEVVDLTLGSDEMRDPASMPHR
jgi:hypothetical protein